MNRILWFGIYWLIIGPAVGQVPKNILEEVYVSVNQQELISGETLLYSAFVTSQQSGQLTDLSSILYVEILDQNGNPVHQAKIQLTKGTGYGEFFIPSTLATGNYHLVAYTRWMKNFNDFGYTHLVIINPFEEFPVYENSEGKLALEFFPTGGNLLADVKNRVLITTYKGKTPVKVKGRLVSQEGDQIADFQSDQNGLGIISWIPGSGTSYQLIIENTDGSFDFYDVPPACINCPSMVVDQVSNGLQVSFSGLYANGTLLISDVQNVLKRQTFQSPNTLTFELSDFKSGLYQLNWQVGSEEILSRYFYIEQDKKADTDDLRIVGTRELVNWNPGLPAGSIVNVSVTKRQSTAANNSNQSRIESVLKQNYPMANLNDWLLIMPPAPFEKTPDTIKYLPEKRHDFYDGRIAEPVTEELPVAMSLPGDDFQFQMSKSNREGVFTIGVIPIYRDRKAFLKVVDQDISFSLELENEFYNTHPTFHNPPIEVDSARIASWVDRSIKNQIENAYYEWKPISWGSVPETFNQFENNSQYVLDDYTRFPTLRDIFIEYIPEVGVRKNESDYRMNIRLNKRFEGLKNPSLVLLDGLPVQHEEVLEITPYAFYSINILNQRFYFGDVVIDGIISFETIEKDYAGINTNALEINCKGISRVKNYQFPDYSQQVNNLPDHRTQLYWNPIETVNTAHSISFYTSDLPGTYDIAVFGVDVDGNQIIKNATFKVD